MLLFAGLGTSLVSGKANRKPQHVRTILVVPSGKLGDIVCVTPVLHAIRTRWPKAKIVVDETGGTEQLLMLGGLADEFVRMNGPSGISNVRRVAPDAGILLAPNFRATATMVIAGIPFICVPRIVGGYSPQETRPYKILSRFVATVPFAMGAYAPLERLRTLEPLGIVADDTVKHLAFSARGDARAKALLEEAGVGPAAKFACIAPGVGNKIKLWPAERFAEVAAHLWERHGYHTVLVGTKADRDEVEALLRALPRGVPLLNVSEKLSLDELKALIARASLFVSADTGPIYIAEAFNVPTVDIVGPVDEREQPPRGPRHAVVVPERSEPAMHVFNARAYDYQEARRQTESITVSDVNETIDRLLASL